VEWARLTSELLETAFDATFFMGSSDSMLVDTSSSGLDDVFRKGMQGCALDETVIVNGVEAAQGLCKRVSSDGSEVSSTHSSVSARKAKSSRCDRHIRAFVTCRDALGWEFDAELRTAPQLASKVGGRSTQLCGMLVFGEKRPPLDTVGETCASMQAAEECLETPITVDIRNIFHAASQAESLPSIPEDQVSLRPSTVLSQPEEPLGTQVDIILDMLSKFRRNARAEKNQAHYRRYRGLAKNLEDSIDDLLYQTQSQMPCALDRQAIARSVTSDKPLEHAQTIVSQSDMAKEPSGDADDPAALSSQVRLRPSAAKQQT